MNRRLMNTVVKMTSSAGVPEASSCAAATIEAPANTTSDISIAAGGARIAVRAFRLRRALFAGLGVLLLRAHRLHQAVAPLGALLALAGLFGLRVRRLHLRHALLAGLRVPGLRAIDVALLRMDAG